MDYALKTDDKAEKRENLASVYRRLAPLMAAEKRHLVIAVGCVILTSAANLIGPALVARVVDTAMKHGDYGQLLRYAGFLALVYLASLGTSYVQTIQMGTVGRNVLFSLRNRLFTQLSTLPVAFFAQNRAGDLISRVNNDTDKLNQFFSQALMQMFGNMFLVLGAGILLLALNWELGLFAIAPAIALVVITRAVSPWVKRTNRKSMESLGALSGDVSESLANFEVIVAFNRVDYFRQKFAAANERNYRAAVRAGISSGIFMPLYTLAGAAGSILVLAAGVWMISRGETTVGLLIGYLMYVTTFYNPLRQMATVWSTLQQAMAALDRVTEMLKLENNLAQLPDSGAKGPAGTLLAFESVGFAYPNGKQVLEDVTLRLERGRTYALVGPTGGGKTTTAMLMARLYDPVAGTVYLDGRDIRGFTPAERARKIGFILQEPFLFSGTVKDNIVYGHDALAQISDDDLAARLEAQGLSGFLTRFKDGLTTPVTGGGDGLSLGQKQLVAFLRAVLREPEILILDEATANIDTVTEQLLEEVLAKLPSETTKVIIAHRLNTIRNADDIFFVGGGALTEAGSMEHALDMLLSEQAGS
ncbi:MAG: ABC transporter ATP-binding protein [Sphingobium sp.]|nr:ABC transporter ATP-binding protein [Sphingobium sp.]